MFTHTVPPTINREASARLLDTHTEGKFERDVLRVRYHARGFIELGKNGKIVQSYLRPKGEIGVIAVVAPGAHGLVVVLEVGLNRSTPYRAVEYERVSSNHGKKFPARTRVRKIGEQEFLRVYPVIARMLEKLVVLQRSTWRFQDKWWPKRGLSRPVHKGMGIRVSKDDTPLYRQILLEDFALRKPFLMKLVRVIRWRLKGFKYATGYSSSQLRSYRRVSDVADGLAKECETPLHLVVAKRNLLGAFQRSKIWVLCEEIMAAYNLRHVDDDRVKEMYDFLYPKGRVSIPALEHIHIRIEVEPGGKRRHGQGCVTAEVIPTDALVEQAKQGKMFARRDDGVPF